MPDLFLERIVHSLMPWFAGVTPDLASREIVESLASFGARTRAEMLSAAQIIAFGLAALDTLRQASAAEMSAALRLRYRNCANSLNRSCQLNEKALAGRLTAEASNAVEPAQGSSGAETEAITQPVQAALHAQAATQAHAATQANAATQAYAATQAHAATQAKPSNPHPLTGQQEQTARHNRIWGGALMDALAAIGMPVQPVPAPHAAPP